MDAETNTTQVIEQPAGSVFDTPPVIEVPTPTAAEAPAAEAPVVETEVTPSVPEGKVKAVPDDVDGDALEKFLKGESDVDPTLKPKAKEEEEEVPVPAPAAPQPQAQPQKSSARDYTGLNEDEVKLFKGMSNDAYKALYPKYQEFKKIEERRKELEERELKVKTAEPKSVYDHERAYELAPAFQSKAQEVQALQFESKFWQDQYAKCESGEDWQPLETNERGQYVAGKAQPATPAAKAQLLQQLTLATQYRSQAEQELKQIAGSYSQRRNEIVSGIKSYEKKYFPFFEDPNSPHQATIKNILHAIPEEMRDHPLSPFLAKAMACIQILNNNNQALTKQLSAKAAIKADAKKAGPNMSSINSSSPSGSKGTADVENMTVEQLDKFMRGT